MVHAWSQAIPRCCRSESTAGSRIGSTLSGPMLWLEAYNKFLIRCLLSANARYLAPCSAETAIKYGLSCAAALDHIARPWEMSSQKTVRQYNGHHKGDNCHCRINQAVHTSQEQRHVTHYTVGG
ncbi:uncharacterized protein LACBIDRAFT_315340 [Laccaria bicolor S238N-H82]|uniref:Predicted protein n=1 Tax=Laccaria bicolor (strain S238N-H82 / ATCC MYA-4686) TaxID=486041 RepID=B0D260_LACBS|nr:uncharacterized protein LACBIDRAFT_315340 [Laccaria bicolor S238N-H82]EDR11046.1 predicted protein [Laccaria bicolor S238N-H82]|eukprot:XP_001878347.1 predicted protein [Laccaria bicolor S238N-H82]